MADKKTRKSGVELLKIIALVLICISHCVQSMEKFVDFTEPSTNLLYLLLKILRCNGNFGNTIFVICSSYFLLNSYKAKKEKAVNLLLDSQVISVGIFSAFIILSIVFSFNVNKSFDFIIKQLFPDVYAQVWFIPTYVALYLVHPYINRIVSELSHKKYFIIVMFIVVLFGIFKTFIPGICSTVYSYFLEFVLLYIVVGYFKLYCSDFMNNKKLNLKLFVISFIVFIGVIVLKNYLGLKFEYFEEQPDISNMLSIVIFPIFISLFNLFNSMKFKTKFINYISSCSLFFYCIHENFIVRDTIRPRFYEFLIGKFGEEHILIYIAAMFVLLFSGSMMAAVIYKITIHKFTEKMSVRIKDKLYKTIDFIFNKTQIKE